MPLVNVKVMENVLTDQQKTQIADRIMSRHFKGTDDALVLVARFLGTGHE